MKEYNSGLSRAMGRREFLQTATRGVVMAAAAPAVLASPGDTGKKESPWKMRMSTSSVHYLRQPLEKACDRIAALGFEAIDIWSAYHNCTHLDDALMRLGPDGLKRVLSERKLKLFAFSVYIGGYKPYAELLGKAGGGVVVHGSTRPCKPRELTRRMREFLEILKPEIELAEK